MKTAIYINQGTRQLVLTPETEFEKNTLNDLFPYDKRDDNYGANIFLGSFYENQGGWYREGANKDSLIIRFDEPSTP